MQTFIIETIMVTIIIKMITLIKPGYKKIMHLFYNDKTKSLHLREISRQTGIHPPSTTRFLEELKKRQILKSKKLANLKLFSLNKNKKTFYLLQIFDLEKLEKLPNIRIKAINLFLTELTTKPIFAILFGSTAKNTFKKESDIDILLVTNQKIKTKKAKNEVDAQTAIDINCFQLNFKDFMLDLKLKQDRVLQSAIETGFPLINHIQYYETIFKENKNERI